MKTNFSAISLSSLVAVFLVTAPSNAGVIRHDRDDLSYRNLANNYSNVGLLKLNYPGNLAQSCSGSLINREWVLTAAHCLENSTFENVNSGSFELETGTYSIIGGVKKFEWDIARTAIDSNLNLSREDMQSLRLTGGFDIGLLRISPLLPNEIRPTPARLYTGFTENRKIGTYVGFGKPGDGKNGVGDQENPRVKRAGQNLIESVGQANVGLRNERREIVAPSALPPISNLLLNTQTLLTSDFDAPCNSSCVNNPFNKDPFPVPLELEYNPAKGDSGGALFIDGTSVGGRQLAGVISGGTGGGKYRNGNSFLPNNGNSDDPYDRHTATSTRVRSYVGWIRNVIKNWVQSPVRPATPNTNPPVQIESDTFLLSDSESPFISNTLYEFALTSDAFANPLVDETDNGIIDEITGSGRNQTVQVPENSSLLGFIALVTVGITSSLKRKRVDFGN